MKEDEKLRLIAVRGIEGHSQAFVWNRYREFRYKSGDTILADVSVCLSKSEREFLAHVKDLDLPVDGSPDDMLATLIAKVFQAGIDAAQKK